MKRTLLFGCVGIGVLLACNGAGGMGEEEPGPELGVSVSAEGANTDEDGWQTQGQELQGTSVVSVSFNGATLGDYHLSNLHLEKGELVGNVPYTLTGTTPSFQACGSTTYGVNRSCGLTWMGVGTCTPGAAVNLGGSSACGLGTCTGDAVVRVCPGTAPCEASAALTSNDDSCNSLCPSVAFTCPSSGTYTVLGGPYASGASWGLTLQASSGSFPGPRTVRGTELTGARLVGTTKTQQSVTLLIKEVQDARNYLQDGVGKPWDDTGATFLYKLQMLSTGIPPLDMCSGSPGKPWAVPVSGFFHPWSGARDDGDPTRFTMACETGVIAKCYRWGYKPWMAPQGTMQAAHLACTRMARADYCGDGFTHTKNDTLIHLWDYLSPSIHPLPADGGMTVQGMQFEAGWNTGGAACLSHARWADMPDMSQCASMQLVFPDWLIDGGYTLPRKARVGPECPRGQTVLADGGACASICDSESDALLFDKNLKHFNESCLNGTDAGCVLPGAADGGVP